MRRKAKVVFFLSCGNRNTFFLKNNKLTYNSRLGEWRKGTVDGMPE
jgi:hypothetical protein